MNSRIIEYFEFLCKLLQSEWVNLSYDLIIKQFQTPGIFSLLKPYAGIVILLIIMALLGSGINLLIPKIIARGIDAFSAGHYDGRLIVIQFLIAASSIFIFTFLQNIIQTYASERVAKDLRTQALR